MVAAHKTRETSAACPGGNCPQVRHVNKNRKPATSTPESPSKPTPPAVAPTPDPKIRMQAEAQQALASTLAAINRSRAAQKEPPMTMKELVSTPAPTQKPAPKRPGVG